jgi:Flp pilus assembly protein TadG
MHSILNRKGQSIVELSLITPLLLVALYVPFDFGMAIFAGHLTQNAVRDGARIASATDSLDNSLADGLADDVFANLPLSLVTPNKDVTVRHYGGGAPDCAQFVEVIARGTYTFTLYRLIGLLGITPPNSLQITRTTRMRYERQPDKNGGTGSTTTACTTVTATGTHS